MSDQLSLSKFIGFCSVFMAIVLFCVVMGGYFSFYRSKNRIEASREYVANACQNRMNLLPELIEMTKKNAAQLSMIKIDQASLNAAKILQLVILAEMPLENDLIKEFELSQTELTSQLIALFAQLDAALDTEAAKEFTLLKDKFYLAQNNLFIAKNKYNSEVDYFNVRVKSFPPLLFAKLFGFNKLKYTELSKDMVLPAHKTFAGKTL